MKETKEISILLNLFQMCFNAFVIIYILKNKREERGM